MNPYARGRHGYAAVGCRCWDVPWVVLVGYDAIDGWY